MKIELKAFKCPQGFTNKKALCSTCVYNIKTFCEEATKKRYPGICGCGGSLECKCGFYYAFCINSFKDNMKCPYCKRLLKRGNGMSLSWKIIKPLELSKDTFIIKKDKL